MTRLWLGIAAMAMLGGTIGCGMFGLGGASLGPSTLDLSRWELTKMDVGFVGAPNALCPGESVQLSIVAELRHRERDKTRSAQTYQGRRAGIGGRNKLGFDAFAVRSSEGTLEPHGWYVPNPDPFASVDGFMLEVEAIDNPSLTQTLRYKPRYDCMRRAGGSGGAGTPGSPGTAGGAGERGSYGGSSKSGGAGGAGAIGAPGGAGSAGRGGPSLTAWATVVRTPHHPHLVLLEFEGDSRGRVMFDSRSTFVLSAAGGPGGRGGAGGVGGAGGDGGAGDHGGAGGSGGSGGAGGPGANGGAGGRIVLHVDERFPELAKLIQLDVAGGRGGMGGSAGQGGRGGRGGQSSAEGASDAADGSQGATGADGVNGPDGPAGVAQVVVGDVDARIGVLPDGVEHL